MYYIHVDEFSPTFQVRADDIGLFDRIGFLNNVHSGDSLRLGISRRSFESKLASPDRVMLFSIQKGDQFFLRRDGVIEENNSHTPLGFALTLLIMAFGMVVYRGIKREREHAEA